MRAQPRKPEWLAQTPPQPFVNATTSVPVVAGAQPDTTVRVLDFPATAPRRPATAADVSRPVLRPAAAAAPPATPFGSTLSLEPAYKSALARLTKPAAAAAGIAAGGGRPGTAPVLPASAASGASARLPSMRLDELLAARPPGSRLGSLAAAPPLSSSRGVEAHLLAQQPSAAQRVPSSRLDQLLLSSRGAPQSQHPVASAAAPASITARRASSSGALAQPVGGRAAAAPRPAAAVLPALPEEHRPPAQSRAEAVPGFSSQSQESAPVVKAGDAARPLPDRLPTAAAASLGMDVEERLRQRTELAKVQIRQQLSPMFRLSQALLGAEDDPGRAAEALEAAAGLSAFERLAMRPGSRGSAAAAVPVAASAAAADQAVANAAAAAGAPSMAGSFGRQAQREPEQHSQQQEVRQAASAATAVPGSSRSHVASGGGSGACSDDAERPQQLARQAAGGARADAGLAPPPLPQALDDVPAGSASALPSDNQPPWAAAEELGLADVQILLTGLRRQAEVRIRAECEQLAASMLSLFDGLLEGFALTYQQQRQQVDAAQAQAGAQAAAPDSPRFASTSSLRSSPRGASGGSPAVGHADGAAALGTAGSAESALEAVALEVVGSSTLPPAMQASSLPPLPTATAQPPAPQEPVEGHAQDENPVGVLEEEGREQQEEQEHAVAQHAELQLAWSGPATVVVGSEAGEAGEEQQASGSVGAPAAPAQSPERGQASLVHRQAAAAARFEQLVVDGPWGAGFGSPIRLASAHPSPARPTAAASLATRLGGSSASAGSAGLGTATAGHEQPCEQAGLGGATPKSLSFEPRPAASEYATPAFHLHINSGSGPAAGSREPAAGRGTDGQAALAGYFTARSHGAAGHAEAATPDHSSSGWPASASGGSSWPAASGHHSPLRSPGGGESEAVSGAASSRGHMGQGWEGNRRLASGPAANAGMGAGGEAHASSVLASGSRDLSSISASIRRMAAEMQLKQGALAATPLLGSSRPASADSAQQQRRIQSSSQDGNFTTPAVSFHSAQSLLGPASARRPGSVSSSGGGTSSLYLKPPR